MQTLSDLDWETIAEASLTHDIRRARGKRQRVMRRALIRVRRKRHTAWMLYRMDAVRDEVTS